MHEARPAYLLIPGHIREIQQTSCPQLSHSAPHSQALYLSLCSSLDPAHSIPTPEDPEQPLDTPLAELCGSQGDLSTSSPSCLGLLTPALLYLTLRSGEEPQPQLREENTWSLPDGKWQAHLDPLWQIISRGNDRTVFIPSAGRRTVPKEQAAHAPPGGDAAGSTGSAGSGGCRKKAPPGRAGSLTPAWGRFEAQGGVTRTLENQHIKVQIAHTCVPLALRSTARAHFSFMGKTGDQHESPELTDRISGPREAEEEKPLQGKDPCFCVETLHSTAMLPGETQTPQTTTEQEPSQLIQPGGSGVQNTDFLLFVWVAHASKCHQEPSIVAYAACCQLDSEDRPLAGTIVFCAHLTSPSLSHSDMVMVTAA
ncbi:hypothetical protein J1605_015995 [Eschrichtius robustus]|uniref:Uncharacterized protein n=1 Tax=Eschrichtius robustus TaxID=9764 RepID=A0AB34G9A9_ESCRO|nr:hypothetical protein J1605_015995 [Eschrichtius robustus]